MVFIGLLVFVVFTPVIASNAVGDDNIEVPSVTAVVENEIIRFSVPGADERETKGRSQFPEDPEIYIPMPIPESVEPAAVTQPENRLVSYNVITGEEIIHESLPTETDMSLSDFVKGGLGIGMSDWFKIGEEEAIEYEEEPEPKNFTNLSLITTPEAHPWRVNVKLYLTFPGPKYYVGSGVLVDSKHVLTAGHCVYYNGAWATSIVVVPAYENLVRPYGDASAVQLHSWTGWTNDGNFDHDIGLIDLDRPIGALTGWHGYGYNDSPGFYTGNTFHNPGYPAASPYNGQYMYYWYGNFDSTDTLLDIWTGNEVRINKLSYGGQSGSGAYHVSGSNRHVYAVLSNGTSSYTDFVRITSGKFGNIGSWISGDTPSTFDLTPLDVSISPSSNCAGDQLSSMSYLVHNNSSVSWSGTVYVDVYLSTNDNISTADTKIQRHSFTWSFSPKSSVRISVSSPPTVPTNVTGDYWIGVILDISDYSTTNNDSDGQDASPIHVDPLPAIPASISYPSSDSDGSFTVSWPSVSGAASYTLQRATNSSFTDATTVYGGSSTSYNQTGLGNGTYYYRVRADSSCGSSGWRNGGAISVSAGPTTTIEPSHGTIGIELKITGLDFGVKKGKVAIGSMKCQVLEWTNTAIRCFIKKAKEPGIYHVTIQPKGKNTKPIIMKNAFTIKAPEIDSITPDIGEANDVITITGSFFGTKKVKVYMDDGIRKKPKRCKVGSLTMDSTTGESVLKFSVPKGANSGICDVTVMNKVGEDTLVGGFTIQ
jgi:V8-like Glu-specific endopeptidase